MGTCFVMQPFDRGVFDKRYEDVLAPAIVDAGLVPYRVDLDPQVSIPIQDIESGIRGARVCLADITKDNPNVWFELGYAFAAGKNVVLVCSSERQTKFPFDIQHRSIIKYTSDSPRDFDILRKSITAKLRAYAKQPPPLPAMSELVDYSTSRRGHFELAVNLMRKECRKLFLMQRSSSLVLGPEQGWGGERQFHDALVNSIGSGIEFVHVVSIEGIVSHLRRPESHFPDFDAALARLTVDHGRVAIAGPTDKWYIKKIPSALADPFLKPDRQARTLLAEYDDGSVEGLIVIDLGGQQGWFSMKGPKVKKFMTACYDFYHGCDNFLDDDLDHIRTARVQSRPRS